MTGLIEGTESALVIEDDPQAVTPAPRAKNSLRLICSPRNSAASLLRSVADDYAFLNRESSMSRISPVCGVIVPEDADAGRP